MSKNENQKERIFVGKGVQPNTKYKIININLAESKMSPHWYEYNGERYITLAVAPLRETDQYGKTHSVWVNNYKPEGQTKETPAKPEKAVLEDDMPF